LVTHKFFKQVSRVRVTGYWFLTNGFWLLATGSW